MRLKKVINSLITMVLSPLKILVPKTDIIILQTHDSKIYCENRYFKPDEKCFGFSLPGLDRHGGGEYKRGRIIC